MRWLSEYLLKGIFLGLLAFIALQETGWSQTGQVALLTVLGFAVSLAIAAWLKLREGYQVGGRVPGFLLFSLLESPRIVYAGVILGLAIGAFSIRKAGCIAHAWHSGVPQAPMRASTSGRIRLKVISASGSSNSIPVR